MSVSREELYRRLRAAEKVLDREWIREMAGQHGGRVLENTFQVAAGVVALQAIGIYAERQSKTQTSTLSWSAWRHETA